MIGWCNETITLGINMTGGSYAEFFLPDIRQFQFPVGRQGFKAWNKKKKYK